MKWYDNNDKFKSVVSKLNKLCTNLKGKME